MDLGPFAVTVPSIKYSGTTFNLGIKKSRLQKLFLLNSGLGGGLRISRRCQQLDAVTGVSVIT
jgi:hypothetical protein